MSPIDPPPLLQSLVRGNTAVASQEELTSLLPANWPMHIPFARITTCGKLTIEVIYRIKPNTDEYLEAVYGPPDTKLLVEKGTAKAFILLALLASQPGCFATKDFLSEKLGRQHEEEDEESDTEGLKRVDNVVSRLRRLLYPPLFDDLPGAKLLRRSLVTFNSATAESGPGYRLCGTPLIWLDVEAMRNAVKRARALEQFGRDGGAEWQVCYDLASQGPFLSEEPYSNWASWRRQEVETYWWDSVQALWRHSVKQGDVGDAEALRLLRDYWLAHITNEDALRPLLELLCKWECFGQAQHYYDQLCSALAEQGKQPDRRTIEIINFVHAAQLQRGRESRIAERTNLNTIGLLPFIQQHDQSLRFAQLANPDSIGGVREPYDHGILGVVSLDALLSGEMQSHNNACSSIDSMQFRRQMLHKLLTIGSTALVLSPCTVFLPDDNESLNPTVIEDFERITEICWRLRANRSIDVLDNIATHFETVVNLLQRPYPRETAQRLYSLCGETGQLLGQTLFDLHEYRLAWYYYMFSLKAAQTAANHDLWAVGIGRTILLLIYWKLPQQALPLLQEVQQLTIRSTRIASWLAAVEAEVHAHLGNADTCDAALKKAQQRLESAPLGEDRYAIGFNPSRLAGYEGACFVHLRQPERALPALERALALLDPEAIRRKSTILTDMGIAYAQQGNVHKACQLAKHALTITLQTKSRTVLERIRRVHSELGAWKETEEVKDLANQIDTVSLLITK